MLKDDEKCDVFKTTKREVKINQGIIGEEVCNIGDKK